MNATSGFQIVVGNLQSSQYVYFHDIILPEFSYSCKFKKIKVYIFTNKNVQYDVILGRSFLNVSGIDVCSSDLTCKWDGLSIPFHHLTFFQNKKLLHEILTIPPTRISSLEHESYQATQVTKTVNTKFSINEIIQTQTHLDDVKKQQLLNALKNSLNYSMVNSENIQKENSTFN